jgi:1,2-diacylglycerol 3-beta-galactosyltransferase
MPVYRYNYVHNLSEMLHASDVLITKAGGLITSEALACGIPILFTEALPGQEIGNVSYVCKHSAGQMVKTPAEMKKTLSDWIRDDQRILRQYAKKARALGKPDAAHHISREIWKSILEKDRKSFEERGIRSPDFGASAWES